ncbi:MAG: alanine racemase [Patescibacteria group bacterium]
MLAKKKLVLKTKGKFDSFGTFRTWIEISQSAVAHNIKTFRKLIGPRVKLWSVVKSNAYGHGLVQFSRLAEKFGASPVRGREGSQRASASNGVDGFCVDSLVEGLKLRKEGIKKPVLVLGPTLVGLSKDAAAKDITLSISNFEILKSLAQSKNPPFFHIKIDTGMSRQGFFIEDIPRVIKFLQHPTFNIRQRLSGVYTHFASAKDTNYPTYTDRQFEIFNKAVKLFEKAGYKNLTKHVSATGGAMISPKYHQDAVRVGIGLYGLWPSKELEIQSTPPAGGWRRQIKLKPILSWKTIISEVKNIPFSQFIGYDLVERVNRPTKIAVLPIGYWHGLPRSLSSVGEVLINGRRAKILGRVSMDLTVVDVTGIKCQVGDYTAVIGKDRDQEITAFEFAQKAGASHYEIVTRLNPLMERILVK